MIKKGLLYTVISEWVQEKEYKTTKDVFDNLPELYKYLQKTEHFGNLVEGISFPDFAEAAQLGMNLNQMQGGFSYTFKG